VWKPFRSKANSVQRSLSWTFSTLGCPAASLSEAAGIAKRFGFHGLELRALHGRIDLAQVLADYYGSPDQLVRAVAASGVPVVAMDTSLRLIGGRDDHRRETVALGKWADALEVPYLRVFDGGTDRQGCETEARRMIADGLKWWEKMRREEGICCRLMVETHWALIRVEDIVPLADECEGNLNLLWDVFHTWRGSGHAPADDWQELKPWVRHIHVKDAIRDPTAKNGMQHCLPGRGDIPLFELLLLLEKVGFKGPVSLEWERRWNPAAPPLEVAIESGRSGGWW
jgi:sugar phosphate isomerase/epimerase